MLFDIAPSEMLLTVIVAVVVIGPKDLPLALRTAGRWMGKMRRVSGHFRNGIETMIREAELEDMEKKWREQNQAIIQAHPHGDEPGTPALIEHTPGEAPPDDSHLAMLSEDAPPFAGHFDEAMAGPLPPAPAPCTDDEPPLPLPPAGPAAPPA